MKVKLRFVLFTKGKSKNDLCTVSLRIRCGPYKWQDTGIEVLQSQFDEKKAKASHWQVIKSHPRQDSFNKQLKNWMDRAHNVVEQLRLSGEPFTALVIKNKLSSEGKPAVEVFFKILAEDRSIKANTKASISTMLVRLKEYSPNILINHIDYEFAKSFEKWLFSKPGRNGKELNLNTVNKYLRDLVRMLEKSIKYDVVKHNKLAGYDHIKNPRSITNKTEHLTFSELELLESFDFSQYENGSLLNSLNHTRDVFLFGCYTGLRISDLMAVKGSDYKKGILTIKTIKGEGKVLLLPLDDLFSGKGLAIFKRYKKSRLGSIPLFADRSRITHQGNIRTIKKYLFPKKKISFHSSRHTFATLLAEMNVNERTIQRYMGHSKLETTTNVYDHHGWLKEHNEIKKIFK